MSSSNRLAPGIAPILLLVLVTGCRSTPEVDPRYRPAENILEVVAVLRRHVPDDTYRFPPARDFTGRNVYRSSLLRLESLERVHAEALRAGMPMQVTFRRLEFPGVETSVLAPMFERVAEP